MWRPADALPENCNDVSLMGACDAALADAWRGNVGGAREGRERTKSTYVRLRELFGEEEALDSTEDGVTMLPVPRVMGGTKLRAATGFVVDVDAERARCCKYCFRVLKTCWVYDLVAETLEAPELARSASCCRDRTSTGELTERVAAERRSDRESLREACGTPMLRERVRSFR
jgi:hypothetical protein